ncbi:MAG: MBL fold metallo-hydrolase [Candidatus Riflebacteria bacterium]|nr:MBL fold metallo-hydrolase [Candidatus Riflebacteria bacterium]
MIRRQKQVLGGFLFFFIFALVFSCCSFSAPLAQVTFIDVGQGDSILIRTKEKNILIDAGDDRFNTGKGIILPLLKKLGINKIDTAVISHPHRDHFGGFLDMIPEIPIGEFLYSADYQSGGDAGQTAGGDEQLYKKLVALIQAKNIPYNVPAKGSQLNWGTGVTAEVLRVGFPPYTPPTHSNPTHPPTSPNPNPLPPALKVNANELSLIIKFTAGKTSYVFTGDSEINAETQVVSDFRDKLKCTVLKSPHHGSRTSSSNAFMDAVQPEYAVISVGKDNSYGHPNQETLDKYASYKIKVFRTDEDGTVDTVTDGTQINFSSNQTPLAFVGDHQILSLTNNSATLAWQTNKLSNSQIKFGIGTYTESRLILEATASHAISVSGLKPDTSYQFIIFSRDSRINNQLIAKEGEFKTPATDCNPLPKISNISTSAKSIYFKRPFKFSSVLQNPASQEVSGLRLEIYQKSIISENLIASKEGINLPTAATSNKIDFDLNVSQIGKVELFAVLKKDSKIVDTSSLNIVVSPKVVWVDCAHGNKDFFTGAFSGMKLDLFKTLGIEFHSISDNRGIASNTFKEAFSLIIPHPETAFNPTEISAIHDYLSKGGSVMLFGQANFKDTSHSGFLNDLLKGIGSGIRFNLDEVCDPTNNVGFPWGVVIQKFPSSIAQGISKIIARNSCSLLNSKMEGLTASKNIQILATGDEDSYEVNGTQTSDSWVYASHTPILPIPVVACEDLGAGRVACFGGKLYGEKSYERSSSDGQNSDFNRIVISWLMQAKDKDLRSLIIAASELEFLQDPELQSIRYEAIKSRALELFEIDLQENSQDLIKDAFNGQSGQTVDNLKNDFKDSLLFKKIHDEGKLFDF